MSKKNQLTWRQKSDIENRELFVAQAFDAESLEEAYLKLFNLEDINNERELIKAFEPMKLSSLVLRGYEAPDFKMRQESNKMIIKAKEVLKDLRIGKEWTNTFWGFMSLQSDTLLEKIEEDLEVVALHSSSSKNDEKDVLLKTYAILKNNSVDAAPKKKREVSMEELQLGF